MDFIKTASDGAEALLLLKQLSEAGKFPQIIITDIRMAGMDGVEFCKALAKEYGSVKFLLMAFTGIHVGEGRRKLEKELADIGVVMRYKPLQFDHLINEVEHTYSQMCY